MFHHKGATRFAGERLFACGLVSGKWLLNALQISMTSGGIINKKDSFNFLQLNSLVEM